MNAVRQALLTLGAIPVGAVGGFVCAAVIVAACSFFGFLYEHQSDAPIDWQLYRSYVLTAAFIPGAVAGGLLLPLAYLICFRHLDVEHLVIAGLWIAAGVLVAGLVASVAQEIVALMASVYGFLVGCALAHDRTKA